MSAVLRRIDPSRVVQVQLDDGRWVLALQTAWVRQPDGSWRASVTYSLQHDHGRGNHLAVLPARRVRLPGRGVAGRPAQTSSSRTRRARPKAEIAQRPGPPQLP